MEANRVDDLTKIRIPQPPRSARANRRRIRRLANLEPRQLRKPITGRFATAWDDEGRIHCAFRVEKKQLNGVSKCPWRRLHGVRGLLPVRHAATVLQGPGVTVSFCCEFLDAAREGELVEGSGEIMRAGAR